MTWGIYYQKNGIIVGVAEYTLVVGRRLNMLMLTAALNKIHIEYFDINKSKTTNARAATIVDNGSHYQVNTITAAITIVYLLQHTNSVLM